MNFHRGPQINWDCLTTVKTFDYGPMINDQESTQPIDHQVEVLSPTVATPISLLVQSLVQQLCSLLERDVERANHLYNSICEKLYEMKLIDETFSMGEFEVMRSQYQRALYQLVSVTSGIDAPISLSSSWPILEPSGFEWSRYHREFEEIFFISGGGFGNVYKAKHRLDGMEYAIKKICIRSSNINTVMNHLAEVKTLASLNHTNIVSYKAAWLEPLIETEPKISANEIEMDTDESDSENSTDHSSHLEKEYSFPCRSNSLGKSESASDFIVSFENSNTDSDKSESLPKHNLSNLKDDCQVICKLSNKDIPTKYSRINLKWATLFIQMSLCQKTLKQWLEERNDFLYDKSGSDINVSPGSSPEESVFKQFSSQIDAGRRISLECCYVETINIFTQLVNGLHYIHSKGIVHHDVKPSNIFIRKEGENVHVQLGDFGLACPLQQSHGGVAIGTHLYAAPEQLGGECNPKSDMYSLGIILLEMTETFHTDMERVKTISGLRKGQIPARLTANCPKIAHIIGKLTKRKASRRLDTSQLLIELKSLNEDKDEVIQSLKEELATKDEEIAKLKILLANHRII